MKSVNINLAILIALGLFLAACSNNDAKSAGESGAATEQMDAHNHDHDHDHSTEAATGTPEGKEYTSAYVCPMHCKGSGSEEAGKCPVCGMDYVARTDHEGNGHTH